MSSEQDRLDRLIERADKMVAFTGAGLSTECGIPDFRSPDSAWRRYPPIGYAAFMDSPAARIETWRRKFAMDDLYAGARPGRAHQALARLVAGGKMNRVITQNIDGLHQASGLDSDQVIELHGNGTFATCLVCGARYELADLRPVFEATGTAPVCACGGPVKSATIAFGQAMPAPALRRAADATLDCDLFVVIGSSLVVRPAADFPAIAKRNGAALAIINRDPTPLDSIADLIVRGDIGTVLDPLGRPNTPV